MTMPTTSDLTVDQLAALVPHGASITLHKGDEPDVPMRLGMALIRRGVRGLHIVTLPTAAYPASGMLVDLLIGAGCVASVETSGISLHELGAAPRFSSAVKAGTLRVLDATLAQRPSLLGDHFTVADLNVAGVMHLMKNIGFDYSAHTHVQRWADTCHARPALARALARP